MSEDSVRISMSGGGQVAVSGLQEKEVEAFRASIIGERWIRGNEKGRLESVSSFNPLPNPINDPEMHPFWRKPDEGEKEAAGQLKMKILDRERADDDAFSARIYITSLCGYCYTPENYEHQANLLLSYGFDVLRSKRDDAGRFAEVWYLPGLWAARGELKERMEEKKKKGEDAKLDIALEFLRSHVEFGSLDASVQRLAMVIDD